MNFLRKNVITFAPHIVWTLNFSIIYTFFAELFNIYVLTDVANTTQFYYTKGLFLFFPLVFLSLSLKKSNIFWKFAIKGAICVIVCAILSRCIVFTVMVLVFFCLRFLNNANNEKSSFDTVNHINLFFLVGYFIFTAFFTQIFLQTIVVYHFLFSTLLIFSYHGLLRFESFVSLRQDKSNLPDQRILEQSTKIFAVFSLIIILFLAPLIRYNYNFISFVIDLPSETGYEYEATEEETSEEPSSENSFSVTDLQSDSALGDFLAPFWKATEYLLYIGAFVVFIQIMLAGIRAFIAILKKPQFVRNDVIETTFKPINEQSKSTVKSKRISEFFDFSPKMKIRRKYKKTLNKFKPQNFQTPTEMEQMANLDIPQLHSDYIDARYNK